MSEHYSVTGIPSGQVAPETDASAITVSRRQVLRMMTAGTAVLAGSGLLAACGETTTTANTVNATLYAPGWPVMSMPKAADRQKDAWTNAYGDMLSKWLHDNPGIQIKDSTANVWSQTALTTAIASNTAPTWYMVNVVGGGDEGTKSACVRGLAAETTDLYSKYNTRNQITSWAADTFEKSYRVNGKYYGAPGDFYAGTGVYYRRDWLQAQGLEEPKPDWNWNDFATLAKKLTTSKHKGAAVHSDFINTLFASSQFDLLTRLPKPSASGWQWVYDMHSTASYWNDCVNLFRKMLNDDQSIVYNKTWGGGETKAAFFREEVAMFYENNYQLTNTGDTDPYTLAKKLGKPEEDLVGFVIIPNGLNGAFGASQPGMGLIGFDPHLKPSVLDKAYDLYNMYYIGPGMGQLNEAAYKVTPTDDKARSEYNQLYPTNKTLLKMPSVPGDFKTYWGQKAVDELQTLFTTPLEPVTTSYIPVEQQQLTSSPLNDAISGLSTTKSATSDVLKTLEDALNAQAASTPSNVTPQDFLTGAKNWYAALDTFWQKNAPDFYTKVYQPWFSQYVQPNLKLPS